VDKPLEALIFNSLSDQQIGPKNIFSNDVFRIEEFIQGRPISIWEMRNPIIMKKVVEIIF
jgi:predicted Ser/Thr protein kinase